MHFFVTVYTVYNEVWGKAPKSCIFENFSGKSNLKLNKYLDLYAK